MRLATDIDLDAPVGPAHLAERIKLCGTDCDDPRPIIKGYAALQQPPQNVEWHGNHWHLTGPIVAPRPPPAPSVMARR